MAFGEQSLWCGMQVLNEIFPKRAKPIDAKYTIDAILSKLDFNGAQTLFYLVKFCCSGAIPRNVGTKTILSGQ